MLVPAAILLILLSQVAVKGGTVPIQLEMAKLLVADIPPMIGF